MEREYIFEKNDELYTRILFSNEEEAIEAGKRLGWKLIEEKLTFPEAIRVCEGHNRPILNKKIRGE